MIDKKLFLSKDFIFSGGMMRSGSTLLYNIIRLILKEKYDTNFSAGWVDDFDKLPSKPLYLIKTHSFDRTIINNATACFYSYRDIRECILSYQLKFGVEPTFNFCKDQINQYSFAKKRGAYLFNYVQLTTKLPMQIEIISAYLNINVDSKKIIAQLPTIKKSDSISSGYDFTTLMHGDHGTLMQKDDWKTKIDNQLLKKIEQKYRWWFEETQLEI